LTTKVMNGVNVSPTEAARLRGNVPIAIFGLALVIIAIAAPGGIQGLLRRAGQWIRAGFSGPRVPAPPTPADRGSAVGPGEQPAPPRRPCAGRTGRPTGPGRPSLGGRTRWPNGARRPSSRGRIRRRTIHTHPRSHDLKGRCRMARHIRRGVALAATIALISAV